MTEMGDKLVKLPGMKHPGEGAWGIECTIKTLREEIFVVIEQLCIRGGGHTDVHMG